MKNVVKTELHTACHLKPDPYGYNKKGWEMVKDIVFDHYDGVPLELEDLEDPMDVEFKLFDFLKKEGIDLIATPQHISPCFINGKHGYNAVVLPYEDVWGNAKERFIKVAHETGHMLDMKYNFNYDFDKFGESDGNQMKTMVAEMSAWHYGEMVMEELGFFDDPDNKQYAYELKEFCIDSYAMSPEEYAYYMDNQKEIVENHEKGIYPEVEFDPEFTEDEIFAFLFN